MSRNNNLFFIHSPTPARVTDPLTTVLSHWQSMFGTIFPYMAHDINAWLSAGIEPEVIIAAIEDTARAPRPCWQYTRAIMRRLLLEDCRTISQWHARQQAYAQRAKPLRTTVSAQQYTQRIYTDEELLQSFVDIEQAAQ